MEVREHCQTKVILIKAKTYTSREANGSQHEPNHPCPILSHSNCRNSLSSLKSGIKTLSLAQVDRRVLFQVKYTKRTSFYEGEPGKIGNSLFSQPLWALVLRCLALCIVLHLIHQSAKTVLKNIAKWAHSSLSKRPSKNICLSMKKISWLLCKIKEILALHGFLIKKTMGHFRHSVLGHSWRCWGNTEMRDFIFVWLQRHVPVPVWSQNECQAVCISLLPLTLEQILMFEKYWHLKECHLTRCPQCPMDLWRRKACDYLFLL